MSVLLEWCTSRHTTPLNVEHRNKSKQDFKQIPRWLNSSFQN